MVMLPRRVSMLLVRQLARSKPLAGQMEYAQKSLLAVCTTPQRRFNSTGEAASAPQGRKPLTSVVKYTLVGVLSAAAGGIFISWIMADQQPEEDDNELVRGRKFIGTRRIEKIDSQYRQFPVTLHLYQYETCPYCKQIRAYLDYFGFTYDVTEVDTYAKAEISGVTRTKNLPILVLRHREEPTKQWVLANATAIVSALESLRNDKPIHTEQILNQYLPVLKGGKIHHTINPYKYHVSKSDLNSIQWRRWINNVAIPVFKLNSVATFKDLFETFDYYADTCDWRNRYTNTFKYYYVYMLKSMKAYRKRSDVINQIPPDKRYMNPRDLLHETVDTWEIGLGEDLFMGKWRPDLADFVMFGTVSAYEGCATFREAIAKHPKFHRWFDRMKAVILLGVVPVVPHPPANYILESYRRIKAFFFGK